MTHRFTDVFTDEASAELRVVTTAAPIPRILPV
jgi:hypothetical protein